MKDRVREFAAFAIAWRNKTRPQVVEEMASYAMETKRLPDPYYFIIRSDGKLVSPQTGQLVEKSIHRESPLGQKELAAFDAIQEWTLQKEGKVAFWISPPHPERSLEGLPPTKIIVSEILEGRNTRILFNRAILLDLDSQECVELANNLQADFGNSNTFNSAEELRSQPVFKGCHIKTNWIDCLESHLPGHEKVWELIRNGKDLEAKEKSLAVASDMYEDIFATRPSPTQVGYDDYRIKMAFERGQNIGIFGQFGPSCPPLQRHTAFQVMYENAFTYEGSFLCPRCKEPIPSGKGITKCPHCGITKEEVGNLCQ